MKLSEIRAACARLEEGDAGFYWYEACAVAAEALPAITYVLLALRYHTSQQTRGETVTDVLRLAGIEIDD